jgi:hypothetical protein
VTSKLSWAPRYDERIERLFRASQTRTRREKRDRKTWANRHQSRTAALAMRAIAAALAFHGFPTSVAYNTGLTSPSTNSRHLAIFHGSDFILFFPLRDESERERERERVRDRQARKHLARRYDYVINVYRNLVARNELQLRRDTSGNETEELFYGRSMRSC